MFFWTMPTLKINTGKKSEMIDITDDVAKLVPHDLTCGVCHIFSTHTTAGLTVNENADPDVRKDMLSFLETSVPWCNSNYRHGEGNSAAHIKASLMGLFQTLPVKDGKLVLGTWQGLYFCEFDGPRNRTLVVQFVKGMEPV